MPWVQGVRRTCITHSKCDRWLTPGESASVEILHSWVRICVRLGEPNDFSPNPTCLVVDTIVPPAPGVVSQDILNFMLKAAEQLGFSPAARTRVQVAEPESARPNKWADVGY